MYLPLTGYNRDNKRGTKMKVGAVTSQVVAPARPGQGVQSQNQEVNNQQIINSLCSTSKGMLPARS
jgi:hypothetical protein